MSDVPGPTGGIQLMTASGAMISVEFDERVRQNEVAYAIVGEAKLKAEVIRIRGNRAELQVFEDTTGLREGDRIEFTGNLLSVELGPGAVNASVRRAAKLAAATRCRNSPPNAGSS